MSDEWHSERMYILTKNNTFVGQAFSLDGAEAIVREHNAHRALLAACKAALDGFIRGGYITSPIVTELEAAIALAEGGEE